MGEHVDLFGQAIHSPLYSCNARAPCAPNSQENALAIGYQLATDGAIHARSAHARFINTGKLMPDPRMQDCVCNHALHSGTIDMHHDDWGSFRDLYRCLA